MRIAFFLLISGVFLLPAHGQRLTAVSRQVEVPFSATVETIEFRGVSADLQRAILQRSGVRVGDVLTPEARQRIGRSLRSVQPGMTFTFLPGSRSGMARVIVSSDC